MWVDRYRPAKLDKMSMHTALSPRLQKLASSSELPHLLLYGPHGSGKKTRVLALLREIYGAGVERTKLESRIFHPTPSKTVEITTIGT